MDKSVKKLTNLPVKTIMTSNGTVLRQTYAHLELQHTGVYSSACSLFWQSFVTYAHSWIYAHASIRTARCSIIATALAS